MAASMISVSPYKVGRAKAKRRVVDGRWRR